MVNSHSDMDAWSRFWRQGHFTTFGQFFEGGYAGPVKAWLDSLAETLSPDGERLKTLELCCGNGSCLPFLLSLERPFDYVGVDAAAVALPDTLKAAVSRTGSTARVFSNTPIEALPDYVQSLSMCLSIYGMEYAPLDVALPGVLSKMSSGAKLFALMHHKDSVVSKMSARAVSEYHEGDIRKIEKALTTIHQTLTRLGSVTALKTDEKAEEARKFMNGMGNKYVKDANMETGNAFMADHVLAALGFFKTLGAKASAREQFIADLAAEAKAAKERHQQMLSVAKNKDDMSALSDAMARMGWSEVSFNELTNKEDIIGWTLAATA